MAFQMTRNVVNGRGIAHMGTDTETGQSTGTFLPTMPGTPYVDPLQRLDSAFSTYGGIVGRNSREYQPTALPAHNRAAVASSGLASEFKGTQRVGLSDTTTTAKAWATATTIDPATIGTQAIRARAAALMDGTDIAGQAKLLQGFNEQQIAGVMEIGMLDALPSEIATMARERYIILRHVRLSGLQADHSLVPSENAPLASGPDVEAARRAAMNSLAALKQRSKNIEAIATVLNDVITMVQVTCELDRPQAYLLLTTGNIDG